MVRTSIAAIVSLLTTTFAAAHAAEPMTTLVEIGQLNHAYVHRIAFSPSGKYCATAGRSTIKLWNATTWEMVGEAVIRPTNSDETWYGPVNVQGLQFSPDEKMLVTCGDEGSICYWNVPALDRRAIFGEPWIYRDGDAQGHYALAQYRRVPFRALALSPDGRTLVVSRFETLQCIDLATQKVIRQFGASPRLEPWTIEDLIPADMPDRAKVRAEGLRMLLGFEIEPPIPLQYMKNTNGSIDRLQFSPDGSYLIADSDVYEFDTGKLVPDLAVRALSPDGQRMVVWKDQRQAVCKFPGGEIEQQLDTEARSLGFFDRRTLYLCEGAFLKLFDLNSGREVWMSADDRASSSLHTVACSPQGVLAASWDGWDRGSVSLYRAAK